MEEYTIQQGKGHNEGSLGRYGAQRRGITLDSEAEYDFMQESILKRTSEL